MQLVLANAFAASQTQFTSRVQRRIFSARRHSRAGRQGVQVNAFFGKLKQMTKDIGGGKAGMFFIHSYLLLCLKCCVGAQTLHFGLIGWHDDLGKGIKLNTDYSDYS